jgi:2-methylisocitrate lyase-like PEP mutase family enzyme
MALTQTDKAEQFRALHEAQDAFVIANVWDGGSARIDGGAGVRGIGDIERSLGGSSRSARWQGDAR